MKRFLILVLALVSFVACSKQVGYTEEDLYKSYAPDGIPFVVADSMWQADGYGNHRATVEVESDGRVARATLPWRRPDLRVESKGVIVVDVATGEQLSNVVAQEVNAERGVILFEPKSGKGQYHIYYMPYNFLYGWHDARFGKPWNHYFPAEYKPAKEWADVAAKAENVVDAKVVCFEERSRFDAFTSMGNIATAAETEQLRKAATSAMMLFPEDRVFQIRLKDKLPMRWVERGASNEFEGVACRNEYYTWQIGVWAAGGDLNNLKVEFGDLRSGSKVIESNSITCFNLEGVNWDGKPLTFDVDVKKNEVQALWCGVQIPENAKAGTYSGEMKVSAEGIEPQIVEVAITVNSEVLADRGEGDLWRMARLSWLNSQIGVSDTPTRGYKNVTRDGNIITATEKQVKVAQNGLPKSIKVGKNEVLARPYEFVVKTSKGDVAFDGGELKFTSETEGSVSWESQAKKQGINFVCRARLEFDGYVHYEVEVSADESVRVKDICLQTKYTPYSSKYFMGAGLDGGLCPTSHRWDWKGSWDSYWIGGAEAGVRVELRGGSYNGPLMRDYTPKQPISWANNGLGYVDVKRAASAAVVAGSGAHTLSKEPLCFEFDLQITPAKPVDMAKHFGERYYHNAPRYFNSAGKAEGANVANIHHSNPENPVINYPFIAGDKLKAFVDEQHKDSCRIKIYYTVRELTNYTHEIYALKSLGHEILEGGRGYGTPWHHEHLIDDYAPAWYTELPNCTADAALVLTSFSRWINYYLEGLRWMFDNYGIDGIYMDDVSFDRPVMKRMRRIMDAYHPDALIDLHSHRDYSNGPAQQYTGFFPYINRLWFGEGFSYTKMTPDEWFVTFSGIPFGLTSDMLEAGGNPWLGMVYGATSRHSAGFNPAPMWKLWREWGIELSKMIGYWDEKPVVKTSHPEVMATAFVKPDGAFIAVGNFSWKKQSVTLDIDWKALGLDPSKVEIFMPEIEEFQSAQTLTPSSRISIDVKRGVVVIVKKK